MSNSTVAKRYGLALFELANKEGLLDQFEEELRVVKEVFDTEAELLVVLKSPRITIEEKREILKTSFASVQPNILNTLMILIERKRESDVSDVASYFIELANDAKGIAEADAYSVRPLTEEEKATLSTIFAKKVAKKSLRINNIIDPELLGGLKIRIGNRIFDGSVRGKVERLEKHLLLG